MEKTMSGILIEAALNTTLKRLKGDPERGIRSMVDMGLRFSRTPLQQRFFRAAQGMLEDESSAYYDLVRDLFSYADTERLLRLGMNLGVHSCIYGARLIRNSQQRLHCSLPWAVLFQMDAASLERLAQYEEAVSQGERLGIYTWVLHPTAEPERVLDLVRSHQDSAFVLFCEPETVSAELADGFLVLQNLLPALRWKEEDGQQQRVCAFFWEAGIPYSAWYAYSESELPAIRSGDLLAGLQQMQPVFTLFAPEPGCSDVVRCLAGQAVERLRCEHAYRTIPLEIRWDGLHIQQVIAGGAFPLRLDSAGRPLLWTSGEPCPGVSLFQDGLVECFRRTYSAGEANQAAAAEDGSSAESA